MEEVENVTQLLVSVSEGNQQAYNKLFPVVYSELKRIAGNQLRKEYDEITLSQTELVHEVYLKLIDQTKVNYNDRSHFYGIAARSMRQILVDYARKKKAQKRGGNQKDITFEEKYVNLAHHASQIIKLDELLDELGTLNERLAKIVELRFFAGLSIDDTAGVLNISPSTANRDWVKARGWLYHRLNK